MTGNKDLLRNTKSVNETFLTPKGEFKATEIGDVRTDDVILLDVLYCPEIRYDLPILSLIT